MKLDAQALKARVEAALTETMRSLPGIPDRLREAMAYNLLMGGKRLRPVLLLTSCQMLGGDVEEAMAAACALEMIHTYSLIHDDLPGMDDDDLRRGQPTNHKRFGEGMAILAGDGLLSLAVEIICRRALDYPDHELRHMRALDAIMAGCGTRGMVAGQCLDLMAEGREDVCAEELFAIHRGKTGGLLVAAVTAGAHLAGAEEGQVAALRAYGEHLGVAFQIQDDILDVVGDAAKLGKQTGMDAQRGKLTYPALFGLEESRRRLLEQTRQAERALAGFGEAARPLIDMARALAHRDH